MSRLAWLQFYPRDWTADTGLRSVSIAARGLWIEVLCIMHQSPDRGYLLNTLGGKIDAPQLARAVGESADAVAALLAELEAAGVFSRDDRGVIVSRRMVRDEAFRSRCSQAGRKGGGNPNLKRFAKGGPKGSPKVAPNTAQSHIVQSSENRGHTEEANASSCPEPAEPASGPNADDTAPGTALAVPEPEPTPDPVLATFAATGPGSAGGWPLRESKLREWQESFPTIDVRTELRKARQWLRDNPAKRKTMGGMPRFLSAWLSRAVDRPRPSGGPAPFDRGAAADARIAGQIMDAIPGVFTDAN